MDKFVSGFVGGLMFSLLIYFIGTADTRITETLTIDYYNPDAYNRDIIHNIVTNTNIESHFKCKKYSMSKYTYRIELTDPYSK